MQQKEFVNWVVSTLKAGEEQNKRSVEKKAAAYGITDKTLVKELTELAIVKCAREIAHHPLSMSQKFDLIVQLYDRQVNLSHRTSHSILLQQYSTPAPVAYLAGLFCGLDQLQFTDGFCFEPSAGNGSLTIAAIPGRVFVNEIDPVRNHNLQVQNFAAVQRKDRKSVV